MDGTEMNGTFFLMATAIGAVVLLSLIGVGIIAVMLSRKSHRQFQKRSLAAEKIDSMLKNGKITESEAGELKKAIGARTSMPEFIRNDRHIGNLVLWEIIVSLLMMVLGLANLLMIKGLIRIMSEIGVVPEILHLSIMVFVLGVFLIAYAIIRVILSLKLKKGARLAKNIIIVISGMEIGCFPIGTALGVYAFWVLLFREGAEEYFEDLTSKQASCKEP